MAPEPDDAARPDQPVGGSTASTSPTDAGTREQTAASAPPDDTSGSPPARGRPRIVAGVLPEGWIWRESLTFSRLGSLVNVIASSEALADDLDSMRYAETQGELLRNEFPEYVEYAFEPMRAFGGMDAYLRAFEWTPPGDEPRVAQMQLYAARDGRGFTATATTVATDARTHEPEMIAILENLFLVEEPIPDPSRTPPGAETSTVRPEEPVGGSAAAPGSGATTTPVQAGRDDRLDGAAVP